MLILKNIVKEYALPNNPPVHALKKVSLEFGETGFVSILGPSGCGKTTLLNIIGGLDKYTDGDVIINGQSTKDYTDQDWDAYRNRETGIVFQSYNLIMHLNVLTNVELAMTLSGVNAKEREQHAIAALRSVGLESEIHKKPNQLSGGQMQRVAVARALVNHPNIILADEPTGALDSKTSRQVMDILKEISKTKLVIVVTHNEEMAQVYSNRIIRLQDGEIISDTLNAVEEKKLDQEATATMTLPVVKPKHTSMSFMTAIGISGRNLNTKKGKTVITAVAASFGIIGVGLVLALSNGFSQYVNRMESETFAKFPLSVERYGYDFASSSSDKLDGNYPTTQTIHVIEPVTSTLHVNHITKDYIDALNAINTPTKTYANIRYNYSIGMHVIGHYSQEGTDVYKSINTSQQSYLESLNDTILGSNSTAWKEFPASAKQILDQYDLLKGTIPAESDLSTDASGNPDQKEFGLILVVDEKNAISTTVMDQLGLSPNAGSHPFDDILGTEFKYVTPDNYFGDPIPSTSDTTGIYFKDTVTMNDIVGVMASTVTSSSTSTNLISSLSDLMSTPSQDDINQAFSQPITSDFNTKLISLLPYVDTTKIQDFTKKIEAGGADITTSDLRALFTDSVKNDDPSGTRASAAKALYAFVTAFRDSPSIKPYFTKRLSYFKSPANDQTQLANLYKRMDDRSLKIQAIVRPKSTTSIGILSTGIYYPQSLTYQTFADNADSTIAKEFKNHILISANAATDFNVAFTSALNNLFSTDTTVSENIGSVLDPIVGNGAFYLNALNIVDNITPYPQTTALNSYMNARLQLGTDTNFSGGGEHDWLNPITYSEFVSTITIYPVDYASKQYVVSKLKAFNAGKKTEDQILYTDVGQTATDIVGQIVQVISAVLIAFASISLVVSSIMIGIIIYSSVVERTKEIGILRSIGARKKDVGRLFKAEAVIIGFFAGIIGVLVTYIVSIPLSLILDHQFPEVELGMIALLNPLHAVLLIIVSVILTYVASLIPARIAAKKDPVQCLRSE
jgi:putative ABC transport system permease protein